MRPPRWTHEEWEAANTVLLVRDRWKCMCCGMDLHGRVERHHRQRRQIGGDHYDNLVCLLPEHHQRLHGNPEWATDRGLIVSMHADFRTTPVFAWGHSWVFLDAKGGISRTLLDMPAPS